MILLRTSEGSAFGWQALTVCIAFQVYASFYYLPVITLVAWFVASMRVMPLLKKRAKSNAAADASTSSAGLKTE